MSYLIKEKEIKQAEIYDKSNKSIKTFKSDIS